jgi:PleD family two-component response regulator
MPHLPKRAADASTAHSLRNGPDPAVVRNLLGRDQSRCPCAPRMVLRILLVDENAERCRVVEAALSAAGHGVVTTASGTENLLARVREIEPDVTATRWSTCAASAASTRSRS